MIRRSAFPVWAAALAATAALTVACGSQPASGEGPAKRPSSDSSSNGSPGSKGPGKNGPRSAPPPTTSGGKRIDSRLVYFTTALRVPHSVHTVLRTDRDRARFPGWFAGAAQGGEGTARQITERIKHTDLKRNVLVGSVVTTGCSKAGGAQLIADGGRLSVRLLDRPKPLPECYAPYQAVSVFEVPRERMPKHPRFGEQDSKPGPAGPGELAAFTEVDPAGSGEPPGGTRKAEVTDRDGLDRFLAAYPAKAADRVRAKLKARQRSGHEGERLFAFQLSGCQLESAVLYVHADDRGLSAVPVGGENIRCIRAVHYLAVFALRSPLVPEHPLL